MAGRAWKATGPRRQPVPSRVAIASTDYVAADRVGIEVMGIDPEWVGYLGFCAQAGLGQNDLEDRNPRRQAGGRDQEIPDARRHRTRVALDGAHEGSPREARLIPPLFVGPHHTRTERAWNGFRLTANGKCRLEHERRTMERLFGNSGISAFPPLRQCYRGILAACSLWTVTILFLAGAAAWAEPVKVWPANPRYMMFQGKPIVLVTSDHHYGAVMDRDFDFAKFLAYLGRSGMNLTRIYPGGMFEPTDKYVRGNPLGPESGRQILPWASPIRPAHPQLAEPGQPSLKYDLDRWDDEYFARLRAFVETAQKHDVIVEVAFFNGMYDDCWPLMALYHRNNIQGVGTYEPKLCWLFTSADPRNADVLERQKAYVRKIVVELNPYDNVIYDICDEPNWSGDTVKAPSPDAAIPWLQAPGRDVSPTPNAPRPRNTCSARPFTCSRPTFRPTHGATGCPRNTSPRPEPPSTRTTSPTSRWSTSNPISTTRSGETGHGGRRPRRGDGGSW